MSNLTPTPIVDKNGKQTTVHKNLNAGAPNTRVAGVGAPSNPSSSTTAGTPHDEYLEAVDNLIEDALRTWTMFPAKKINGDRCYTTGSILLGRNENGDRIYISMDLEHVTKETRTTDLEEVSERWDVTFAGSTKPKGSRHENNFGQTQGTLNGLQTGIGSDAAAELAELWERNHANFLKGGTDLQTAKVKEILAETGESYDYSTISPQIEDDRGYKYGSAWLYKQAPIEDIERVLSILQEAKSTVFN